MHKHKIVAHSIVLADKIMGTQVFTPSAQPITIDNPFQILSNHKLLRSYLESVVGAVSDPVIVPPEKEMSLTRNFLFGKIRFVCDALPPRFTVAQEISDLKDSKVKEILDKIIDSELTTKIGAIGINYEIFIPEKIDITKKIIKENVTDQLVGFQTQLTYTINDNCKLNLSIASNSKYKNQDGLSIVGNFHNIINSQNSIETVLGFDYYSQLENKINAILK